MASNLSALLVDPNLDSRLDAAHVVHSIGFDCSGEAAYGTEAVYLAAEHHPNVILLSLEEPPVRGLATLEALQQQMPDIPILVYSGSLKPHLMREAMRAGARDFLAKPLQSAELQDALHVMLSHEEQRQLGRWSDRSATTVRGTVLTVAGAKGGIGKTTLATNLAIALRRVTGQEVALVDGDAQFGDVSVMLDLDVKRSIADLARSESEINRATVLNYVMRHSSGLNVLAAASEPDDWRAVQPEHMSSIARALSEAHEYVVIDTPGVINEVVAASLSEAAVVLLVTSLDVSSIKDTKTALRILESWAMPSDRVQLVVNDTSRAQAVSAEDVAHTTNVRVAKVIAYDSQVGMSVQTGVPMVVSAPQSGYSRSVTEIAENIAGVVGSGRQARPSLIRLPQLLRRA